MSDNTHKQADIIEARRILANKDSWLIGKRTNHHNQIVENDGFSAIKLPQDSPVTSAALDIMRKSVTGLLIVPIENSLVVTLHNYEYDDLQSKLKGQAQSL